MLTHNGINTNWDTKLKNPLEKFLKRVCENKVGPIIQNPQIIIFMMRVGITIMLSKKNMLKIHLKMLTYNGINTNWDTNFLNHLEKHLKTLLN